MTPGREEIRMAWWAISLIAFGAIAVAAAAVLFFAARRDTYEMPGGETIFDAPPQPESPSPHPLND